MILQKRKLSFLIAPIQNHSFQLLFLFWDLSQKFSHHYFFFQVYHTISISIAICSKRLFRQFFSHSPSLSCSIFSLSVCFWIDGKCGLKIRKIPCNFIQKQVIFFPGKMDCCSFQLTIRIKTEGFAFIKKKEFFNEENIDVKSGKIAESWKSLSLLSFLFFCCSSPLFLILVVVQCTLKSCTSRLNDVDCSHEKFSLNFEREELNGSLK